MERNVDKIKRLEHELGRYRKKVADQGKELNHLRKMLGQAHHGNRETQALVDALLTAITLEHGEVAHDPDEPEKELGWRLSLHRFNFAEMRAKYEVHARKDQEADAYIIGVVPRGTRADDEAEKGQS